MLNIENEYEIDNGLPNPIIINLVIGIFEIMLSLTIKSIFRYLMETLHCSSFIKRLEKSYLYYLAPRIIL